MQIGGSRHMVRILELFVLRKPGNIATVGVHRQWELKSQG